MLLDRFTLVDVAGDRARGRLLRDFHVELYYGLEAQRELHKNEILDAILKGCRPVFECRAWNRIVDLRFSADPLSAQGSLLISGRFNIGDDVDPKRFPVFPALYLASDFPTAYCEKFQIPHGEKVSGLSAEELHACQGRSWTKFEVNGELRNVLDLGNAKAVQALCRVFPANSKFRRRP